MLDDVDIYAPFRDNGDENSAGVIPPKPGRRPARRRAESEVDVIYVSIVMQTTLGFAYEIKFPCKPSGANPKLPDPADFVKRMNVFVKNYNADKEAMKIYQKSRGKIPLGELLKVTSGIGELLHSVKPSRFLDFIRKEHGDEGD